MGFSDSLALNYPEDGFFSPRERELWELILLEPWSGYVSPPEFALILTEPWSGYTSPLSYSQILTEEWSS